MCINRVRAHVRTCNMYSVHVRMCACVCGTMMFSNSCQKAVMQKCEKGMISYMFTLCSVNTGMLCSPFKELGHNVCRQSEINHHTVYISVYYEPGVIFQPNSLHDCWLHHRPI